MTSCGARVAWLLLLALAAPTGAAHADEPAVRITSPLGRTGVPGVIRVVAQVTTDAPRGVVPVHFFVDGTSIGDDIDGPPYVVEWEDANPYEAREIASTSRTARAAW